MRAVFEHNNHSIVIERGITVTKLLIDNEICDQKKGTFVTQLTNYDLHGEIQGLDGIVDKICVSVRIGLMKDNVTLFYNGKEVKTIEVRA